ncbi:MAG TPA: LysE family transporter [bacterium]|nr:LysE family transporter [bacterium]
MNLFTLFLSAFAVGLSGALSPGPLLSLTISSSLQYGVWQGPLIILGHAFLEILLILFILKSGAGFFDIPLIQRGIYTAGGILMILLAGNILFRKSAEAAAVTVATASAARKKASSVIVGILGSLSNPYWLLWWLTIGLGLLIQARQFQTAGIISFFMGHISADFLWYSAVSFSIGRNGKLFPRRIQRIILLSCAAFLAVLGLFFLKKGLF